MYVILFSLLKKQKPKQKKKADKENVDPHDEEDIPCLMNDSDYIPPKLPTVQPKRQRISRGVKVNCVPN